MNTVILFIICIPLIEIYLLIKVGGMIGAFNTIFLIFFTAITGVYFARLAGLNAIRSGFNQLIKNEIPIYELMSGATLAIAALLLIFPGFLTDLIGFFIIHSAVCLNLCFLISASICPGSADANRV